MKAGESKSSLGAGGEGEAGETEPRPTGVAPDGAPPGDVGFANAELHRLSKGSNLNRTLGR